MTVPNTILLINKTEINTKNEILLFVISPMISICEKFNVYFFICNLQTFISNVK